MSYSDEIRRCRDGVVSNPYQGTDRKVLFVCSMGILRSATGARLYASKYNTRCCGAWDDALIPITPTLIAWAEEIVFVNEENYHNVINKYGKEALETTPSVKVLNIPDRYSHMHEELVKAFKEQYEPLD